MRRYLCDQKPPILPTVRASPRCVPILYECTRTHAELDFIVMLEWGVSAVSQ